MWQREFGVVKIRENAGGGHMIAIAGSLVEAVGLGALGKTVPLQTRGGFEGCVGREGPR